MKLATDKISLDHLAIIMDGNGRWAEKRGLPRIVGHRAGVKTLIKLIEHAIGLNFHVVTVYAFSQENWQRPATEVNLLTELFTTSLKSQIKKLNEHNIRLKFIGEISSFHEHLQRLIYDAEQLTKSNSGLSLNVAVNYGGRWDILQACRSIISEFQQHAAIFKEINEDDLSKKLCLSGVSEPDLFIRTGGEQRISNYLLWQLAYTELYFTDTLWPDFDAQQLAQALQWYAGRQRRFGRTAEQLEQLKSV